MAAVSPGGKRPGKAGKGPGKRGGKSGQEKSKGPDPRSRRGPSKGDSPPIGVLLVDDDEDLNRVLVKGLRRHGFAVASATTAAEALRVAADSRVSVDVIVMDLLLPDQWGAQAAMEDTLFRPDVQVIYISGHSAEDEVFAASVAASDVAFLAKPFDVTDLAKLIRQVMADRKDSSD